jgi:hypothetical protein
MSNAFFRIRQNLIRERKYGEYFSIALGEMILIALSIFLALQVDNWNQKRQEKKIIESYLMKIVNELNSDVQSIESLLEDRKQALIYTDSILKYYRIGQIYDSKLFEKGYFSVFVESEFQPITSAYESLKNSGYMKDLENPEIEEQIIQYYQLVENLIFVEDKFNNITQPVEISLAEKGFYNEYQSIFKWDNEDTIQFTIQSMRSYPEYQATFIKAKLFLEELILDYSGLVEKAKETIELIDERD